MSHRTRSLLVVCIVAVVGAPVAAPACTTAVVSGRVTPDGRPILWKNRDTSNLHNQIVFRDDGRYAYLGVVNKGDALGMEIWAGINNAGFAIMNSASYNLDAKETTGEGAIMKLALQSCRTVGDFQALLELSNATGRDTTANFGVIDAAGGAAFFETGTKSFVRYDATDEEQAPHGYLIRTNHSVSGDPEKGSGWIRYQRAERLLGDMVASSTLDVPTLLARVARDVANAATGAYPRDATFVALNAYIGDSINRSDTAAAAVFHGVRSGEDPLLATMWVVLGQPVSGVAVPLWVRAGSVPSELAAGTEPAPLNAAFDRVRARLIPDRRGEMKRYLDVRVLRDPSLLPALEGAEAATFKRVAELLAGWRATAPTGAEVAAAQSELAAKALAAVATALGDNAATGAGAAAGSW